MDGKFNMWTITYINKKGTHSNVECQDKAEVSIELAYLRENGQDMEHVNIFPPKSNLTYNELLNY